tara:strand:+ start:78960 stop:79856 length:897 start_codon:yes stop_codon:yes gene_type:complete
MKKTVLLIFVLFSIATFAQNATEVYLFDLIKNDSTNTYSLKNPINISDNVGFYDNQPSFLNDGSGVLFASTRDGQTDVALYNIADETKSWLTNTLANEYSPIQTPNRKFFSAIKLEDDETQLLWIYPFSRRKEKVLIENLTVGYHVWIDKRMVVSFVLNDPPTLEVSNLKYKIKYPIEKNIGRSILKIPTTSLISFISQEHADLEIYSINPVNSEKEYIADALEGSQDMAWTPDKTIVMGKGNKLFKLKPGEDESWIEIASLEEFKLDGITRLSISPLGTKIAIVIDEVVEEASESNE